MDEFVVVETETPHGVYRARLELDPDCPDPRSFSPCHLGVMALRYPGHTLPAEDSAGMSAAEALALVEEHDWPVVSRYVRLRTGATVVLPIWVEGDHNGPAVGVGSENDRYTRGNVIGLIYDTPQTRAECGTPPELIGPGLADEVGEWSSWSTGDVWSYVVERHQRGPDSDSEDWELVDSGSVLIGHEYAESRARDAVRSVAQAHRHERAERRGTRRSSGWRGLRASR